MATDVPFCLSCKIIVKRNQHAISCDSCNGWTHRKCGTGITIVEYRRAVKSGEELNFVCPQCLLAIPNLEVTAIVNENDDQSLIEEDRHPSRNVSADDVITDTSDVIMQNVSSGSQEQVNVSGSSQGGYENADLDLTQDDRHQSRDVNADDVIEDTSDAIIQDVTSGSQEQSFDGNPTNFDMDFNVSAESAEMEQPVQPSESDNSAANQDQTYMDTSFDISDRVADEAPEIMERSVGDAQITNSILEDEEIEFEVLENASNRGKRKLVSSDGYAYTVKKISETTTLWRCQVRNKNDWCRASVSQRGENFITGRQPHSHAPDPLLPKKVKIRQNVISTAKEQVFRSANDIVSEQLDTLTRQEFNLPKPANLQRAANRTRKKLRPDEPKDLSFQVNTNFLGSPEFVIGDVKVGTARHIMFATQTQLNLLAQSKRWYMDGTFKIVRDPFIQLFSIHAFIKKDDSMKQVPLCFVLMSRRRADDYKAVLEQLLHVLDREPDVQGFVMDFESGMWTAVMDVFPGKDIKGCCFHWAQAVLRKVNSLGLKTTYERREGIHQYIRKLMALPFLPGTHIQQAFHLLRTSAATEQLKDLVAYLDRTWMMNSVWTPSQWSVYRQSIRTNNDVEGWHRRINGMAGRGQLQFYVLVPLLLREAKRVDLQLQLVSEDALTRYRANRYKALDGKLIEFWDKYDDKTTKTSSFLREVGKLYAAKV